MGQILEKGLDAMYTITGSQELEMIAYAVKQLEMPEIILAENAACQILSCIDLERRHTFAIFCGTQFKGACGLAVARQLLSRGKKVQIFIIEDMEKASSSFRSNYQILFHMKASIKILKTLGDIEDLYEELKKVNTVIDAIFGAEEDRSIAPQASIAIEQINESRIFTLSIDIASGIDVTSGRPLGDFIDPGLILTFEFMKRGIIECPYLHCPVKIIPIGLPREAKYYVLGNDWEGNVNKEEKNVRY